MKVEVNYDLNRKVEDQLFIEAKEENTLINNIIDLCDKGIEIVGYLNNCAHKINLNNIFYFKSIESKTYAISNKDKYLIKGKSLESIYERIKEKRDFVQISQSTIINLKYVKEFDLSFVGTIRCLLINGDFELVSRRKVGILKQKIKNMEEKI